jgi:hypothetical protein
LIQEFIILAANEQDLQAEKGHWLAKNSDMKIIETNVGREPSSLLSRIGGKGVPRVSMLIRYEVVRAEAEVSMSAYLSGGEVRR